MARIIREQQNENGQNGYIQSKDKEVKIDFVGRVSSIPIIKDSVSTAQNLTNKTSIGRFALSKANLTLQYAIEHQPKSLTSYYEQYLYPQVQKADAFGCRSLDIIQKKYPVVNQPTSEIISSVTQPSYQIIDGVKVRIDSTLQTVTYPAHVVVQEANKQLSRVVDNLETAVDKYLPADQQENKKEKEENQVKRAYDVLSDASRRISQKVTDSTTAKSRELTTSNALLLDIQSKLNFIQETLVKSIAVYGTAAQEKLPPSVIARVHQTTALFSQVTETIHQQVGHIADFLKSRSPEIPDWLKQNLQTTIQAIQQQIMDIKKELARTDISYADKLKHVTSHAKEQITPLLEKASSQLNSFLNSQHHQKLK